MASSNVQLISKKLVKPSSPTPSSLTNYKLSLMDQLMENKYIPMAFFYPKLSYDSTIQVSTLLEESLSKILTVYYPFAGRLGDNISVICNDTGATFVQVRIKCSMSQLLKEEAINAQGVVFPSGLPWSSGHEETSLVVAQLSHFECGGIALSVCMSHKVGDANTLCNFIDDWAVVARQSGWTYNNDKVTKIYVDARKSSEKPSPQFIGESILPPNEDPSFEPVFGLNEGQQCITKRYVFDTEKISQLKVNAATEYGVQKPTRVEVVSALLYKSAVSASILSSGSFRPSLLASLVNFRTLIGPPVSQKYVGNLVSYAPVLTFDDNELNLAKLVNEIRKAKLEHYEKYTGIETDELISATLERAEQIKMLHGKNEIDEYVCSSFCRYPTYDVDFGWGRPIRVSVAASPFKNYIILMDNDSCGIEAFVTLEEQVMSVFQSNQELRAFASIG